MSSAYITNTSTQFIPRIFRKNGVISSYETDDIHRHTLGKQPCGDHCRIARKPGKYAGFLHKGENLFDKKENHDQRG